MGEASVAFTHISSQHQQLHSNTQHCCGQQFAVRSRSAPASRLASSLRAAADPALVLACAASELCSAESGTAALPGACAGTSAAAAASAGAVLVSIQSSGSTSLCQTQTLCGQGTAISRADWQRVCPHNTKIERGNVGLNAHETGSRKAFRGLSRHLASLVCCSSTDFKSCSKKQQTVMIQWPPTKHQTLTNNGHHLL
jgi:hypothetical protein